MDTRQDKVMPLREAIREYVKDGSHISIGGFTINRNPMAAVYEIIRQGIRDLHLYAHSNGQGADELIGGGCVSRMDIAYWGNGKYAPTCIRFRKAVQEGYDPGRGLFELPDDPAVHGRRHGGAFSSDGVVPGDRSVECLGISRGDAEAGAQASEPEDGRDGESLRRVDGHPKGGFGSRHPDRCDDSPCPEGGQTGDGKDSRADLCRRGAGEVGQASHPDVRRACGYGRIEEEIPIRTTSPSSMSMRLSLCRTAPIRRPATGITTTIPPSFGRTPNTPRTTGATGSIFKK